MYPFFMIEIPDMLETRVETISKTGCAIVVMDDATRLGSLYFSHYQSEIHLGYLQANPMRITHLELVPYYCAH